MNPGWKKLSAVGTTEYTDQKSRCFYDGSHQEANLGASGRDGARLLFEKCCDEYLLNMYYMPTNMGTSTGDGRVSSNDLFFFFFARNTLYKYYTTL